MRATKETKFWTFFGIFMLMAVIVADVKGCQSVSSTQAATEVVKHIINCDADPFLPDGWKVEEHRKGGWVEWDPAKVELYLSPNQKNNNNITGYDLCSELSDKPVMNANVLDYLLAHPQIIPDDWRSKAVHFWGTVYRHSGAFSDITGDTFYVRDLQWDSNSKKWYWSAYWLNGSRYEGSPAALLVREQPLRFGLFGHSCSS